MKKNVLLCIVIFSSILFFSCKDSFINSSDSDAYILPNGYKLSVDEQILLKDFAVSKGFLDESGRAIESTCSDENIQNMINSLIEEFGESAYNYFGEIEVSDQPYETDSSRKAGSIFKGVHPVEAKLILSDEYAKQYDAFFKATDYKVSWGLWWFKYKNVHGLTYGRIKYTTHSFGLTCTSIQWNYQDSVTNKEGNAQNTSSFSMGSSKTKYGWLPEMSANITATVSHPWIAGSQTVTAKIVCE